MKTLKTFFSIVLITAISTASFAQNGLLGKAKEEAKKSKDKKPVPTKGGKSTPKDIAVKGTGVPTNTSATKSTPTTTVTPNK